MTTWTLAERAAKMNSSAIREILKLTDRPGIISMAGGLPSPKAFPLDAFTEACQTVMQRDGAAALQYSTTEGFAPLRQAIADFLPWNVDPEQILITTGSQQALDLIGKVFLDKGSRLLVEKPTYLGALQAFTPMEPVAVGVDSDDEGMLIDDFAKQIGSGADKARLAYVLPNFQNPTGRTLSLERRIALVKRAAELGLTIIEDDPYGELRYAGEPQPGLIALAAEYGANVVRLGTFSKVLAPGLRLGYIAAARPLINKLVQAKQATDLHTPTLTQMAVYEIVKDGFLEEHLPNVREIYRAQGSCMLDAIAREFPATVSWTKPEGGMFIWVTLPEHIDSTKLLEKAIAQNVAFVPGAPFYSGAGRANTLRLSFATVPEDKIRTGIAILGKLLKEYTA